MFGEKKAKQGYSGKYRRRQTNGENYREEREKKKQSVTATGARKTSWHAVTWQPTPTKG